MKNIVIACIILSLGLSFSACEKDDICVEDDTPLLIIRFYDIDNPTVVKPVLGIRVVGIGKTTPVDTFSDRTELDSISIPLNPSLITTEFSFINNSNDQDGAEAGNTDGLSFSYEVKEKYVGRACGFIATYDNLTFNLATDPENWIQNVTIEQTLVESLATEETTTAHVKIFH